jgi:hypothetical protein
MKRVSPPTRLLTTLLLAALMIMGCQKEKNELTATEEEAIAKGSTESEARSELVFNDIFDNVMGVNADVGIGGTGVFGRGVPGGEGKLLGLDSLACLTVTKTYLNAPALFPVKFVLDFGTSCIDNHGHLRSGKIIIVYSGRLIFSGSMATTTFDNYKFDSVAVTGTHKIINTTPSGSNQRQFTIDVIDGKLTKINGDYHKWTSHRVITQIEGNGTPLPLDDIFKVQGTAFGQVKLGNLLYNWNSEIIEPLVKRFNCAWISKGELKIKRQNLSSNSPWVATLNYGTGLCDFLATLTINGVSQTIQLPH